MLVKENRARPMEKRRTALYRAILSVYSVPTSNVRQSDWKITRSFDSFFSYFFSSIYVWLYVYIHTSVHVFILFFFLQFLSPSYRLASCPPIVNYCRIVASHRRIRTRRKTKLLSPLNAHRRAVLIESRAVYTTSRYSLLIIIYRTRRCWRDLFH